MSALAPEIDIILPRLEKEYTEFASQRDPQYRYDPPTFYLQDAPLTMQGDVDLSPAVEQDFYGDKTEYFVRSATSFKIHVGDHFTYDVRYRFAFGPGAR